MKSAQPIFIKSLLCLAISFLVSCQKTTKSNDEVFQLQIEFEIIPSNEVPKDWDSTFYQQNSNWAGFFDTTAADLLADELKDSNLPITDMWFPQVGFICGVPIRAGSEVIIKLSLPDTSIYQFGFQPQDGFPVVCVHTWRHYKFVEVSQGG